MKLIIWLHKILLLVSYVVCMHYAYTYVYPYIYRPICIHYSYIPLSDVHIRIYVVTYNIYLTYMDNGIYNATN
jgi:hypothetical protein